MRDVPCLQLFAGVCGCGLYTAVLGNTLDQYVASFGVVGFVRGHGLQDRGNGAGGWCVRGSWRAFVVAPSHRCTMFQAVTVSSLQ